MDERYQTLRTAAIYEAKGKSNKEGEIMSATKKEGETNEELLTRILGRMETEGIAVDPKYASENPNTMAYFKYLAEGITSAEEIVCSVKRTPVAHFSFNDVVGQFALKDELRRSYIYPIKFSSLFRKRSKGVMLYGPPGTGKTFIVKAATNELDRTAFFAPTTGELLGKYLGDVEKKIDALYKCAAKELQDPKINNAVIFLDEFDTLAGLKTDDKSMARSVNALLQAMDGLGSHKGVSTIAATNYPWNIESAVRRRFSNEIFVDLAGVDELIVLIEMAIFDNFYDINEKKKKYYDVDKAHTYDYIERYGSDVCKNIKMKVKGVIYSSERAGSPVTRSFLEGSKGIKGFVAQHLGMNDRAKQFINDIKNNPAKRLASEDESNMPRFGYSPSDITRVMEIAIGQSAKRALAGWFVEAKIDGKDYFVSSPDPGSGVKKYYVATPNDARANMRNTDAIPSNRASTDVLNFGFCEEDLLFAVENYKPTVGAQDYMDLLRYSVWKLSPNE